MALAKGNSEIRCGPLTLHTKTAIYVAEHLLGVSYLIVLHINYVKLAFNTYFVDEYVFIVSTFISIIHI